MEQLVVPVVHGLPVPHATPGVHAEQLPTPSHTPPVHTDPNATFPVAMHTAEPAPQLSVPVRQGAVGVHVAPATHGAQLPAPSHTPPVQVVPAVACGPGTHVGAPDAQEVAPVSHGFAGVHDAASTQATHAPAELHTWSVPHGAPMLAWPLSWQTGAPVAHVMVPT